MKRVLLTGACGFIGTTAQEAWDGKYQLIGLDRVPPRERWAGVQYRACDILDRGPLGKEIMDVDPDVIVHLAARARVADGEQDPIGTYRTNVEGTINVLEAASRCPSVEKVVYVSSETVYGAVETYPTPEELGPGKPGSVYAASKAAADLIAQQFTKVPVVVARSAMGCGPRSDPREQVVSRFVQNVLAGKPMRFPGTSDAAPAMVVHPTRDVSPAWNFIHGMRLIIDNADAKGVYNLATGREVSLLGLAKLVQATLGKGEIAYDPTFQYRRGEEGYRTVLDISRAKRDLGYEPIVSLEEAIRLTGEWMQKMPGYWQSRRVEPHHAWQGLGGL